MKRSKASLTLDRPVTYRISVPGALDESWSGWVQGMTLEVFNDARDSTVTALTVTVDQAALHGLLRRLYAVGLPLISVICVECNALDAG